MNEEDPGKSLGALERVLEAKLELGLIPSASFIPSPMTHVIVLNEPEEDTGALEHMMRLARGRVGQRRDAAVGVAEQVLSCVWRTNTVHTS